MVKLLEKYSNFFTVAVIVGTYSYTIFYLGILGYLYTPIVQLISVVTLALLLSLLYVRRDFFVRNFRMLLKLKKKSKSLIVLLALLVMNALVNVIGAIAPELAFDALWYHLTLPKLYLLNHAVYHIPGGLLYYSDMPKLGEMLYVGALALGNEINAKLLHFLFGVFVSVAIYLISRKYFSHFISVLAVIIFYSNLVVAWESTTAYVDLIRTFYEIMALWGFINWFEKRKYIWLLLSAIMLGFAITTKLLAFGSLVIFTVLLLWIYFTQKKKRYAEMFRNIFSFWIVAFLIPLPWLVFAYIHTGNPVYPFFSEIYRIVPEPLTIAGIVLNIWTIFMRAADPISPIYMLLVPVIVWFFLKKRHDDDGVFRVMQIIGLYSLLAVIVWYFTPRTGGGRFILPYLPAFSILCAGIISAVQSSNMQYKKVVTNFLIVIIILVAMISIGYRSAASYKYLPVVFGQQSKDAFLTNNLNFSYGDFYDVDKYFSKHIKSSDKVLLYGFHNLYYVDFPFIDSSWVRKGDRFNYIAVQKSELPERFRNWQLIHSNAKTTVKIYKPPKGTCRELCIY